MKEYHPKSFPYSTEWAKGFSIRRTMPPNVFEAYYEYYPPCPLARQIREPAAISNKPCKAIKLVVYS